MTVQIDAHGDFVQTVDSLDSSNVVSDMYDILSKSETSVGTLAHEVRKALDIDSESDADLAQWCDLVTSVPVVDSNDNHDGTLGAAFYYSTDYSASEYTDYEGKYNSINTVELGETELSHQKDELVDAGIIDENDSIEVPVTSDGDVLPIIAVSNDRDESHPTFEEAKETLQSLMDTHFEEVEEVEVEETTDSSSGSDTNEDFFLSDVDKVGPATSENIRDFLVENQVTLDYREHIDADSDDWRTTVVTKEAARERLQQVALDMDSDDFSKASELIEQGNTDQAIMAIEQYE